MLQSRLGKELERLENDPGPGITAWKGKVWNEINAQIIGPENSPYSNGIFNLLLIIPDRSHSLPRIDC
jgi:ubiquitin-conjugating enzyme E2 T